MDQDPAGRAEGDLTAEATAWTAARRPLTIDDLPTDAPGRFELIDGGLYVSPLGDVEHQRLVSGCMVALLGRIPADLDLLAGVNVILGDDTLVEPDVAVIDTAHLVRGGLGVSPTGLLLAVEITSPSTQRRDLTIKRELYAEWGVPFVLVDRGAEPHRVEVFGELPEYAQGLAALLLS